MRRSKSAGFRHTASLSPLGGILAIAAALHRFAGPYLRTEILP